MDINTSHKPVTHVIRLKNVFGTFVMIVTSNRPPTREEATLIWQTAGYSVSPDAIVNVYDHVNHVLVTFDK